MEIFYEFIRDFSLFKQLSMGSRGLSTLHVKKTIHILQHKFDIGCLHVCKTNLCNVPCNTIAYIENLYIEEASLHQFKMDNSAKTKNIHVCVESRHKIG